MFKSKLILLTASLVLISELTVTKVVQAQNNQNNHAQTSASHNEIETELISIALSAIQTENDILVNGNIIAALNRNSRSSRAKVALQRRFEKTLERRKFLADRQIGFKSFQTKLEIKNIQINGDTATLEAKEKTIRDYDLSVMPPDAPKTTESHTDHLFSFVLRNGQWELSSDQLLNVPSPPTKPDEKSVPVDPSVTPADPLAPQTDIQSSLTSQQIASASNNLFGISRGSHIYSAVSKEYQKSVSNPQLLAQATLLNRSAIVQYIYYYALTPNQQYRNFENSGNQGGDCTNFVSQALKAGGWTSVQGYYQNDTVWWYDYSNNPLVVPAQSWTWIGAGKFFQFIQKRPRATTIGRVADLIPGDVISVDFDPQNNNGIDHTMLVSKKTNNGTIYLAYHTNNTLDKTFYDFYNQSPSGAKYYAWSLLSSYY